MTKNSLVQVCATCRRASCWQGIFMCDHARSAGTIMVPVRSLRQEARESEDYWLGHGAEHQRGDAP